jgi:hypothetical protein
MLAFRNDRFSPSGTDGSNPVPSSGESGANFSQVDEVAERFRILDVSVAEREAQVEPDRMLDDNGRKPVTTV